MGRQAVGIQVPQRIVDERTRGTGVRRHWASVVGSRLVVNLRGCARTRGVWHGVVDLGGRRTSRGSTTDTALSVGARAGRTLGRLPGEAIWARSLLVRRLEGRLLRWRRLRRRRTLEARRRLRHLMLLRTGALLLRRRLRRQTGLTTLSGHDSLEQVVSHADGGRRHVGRAAMLGRTRHALLRSASSGGLELAAE